jgi:nondiscriminating glutamyl-tRNA synthetase
MSDPKVRVRFAPSPTGSLHMGVARTALFNWLYARNMEGAFILRVEDTDRERSTIESEQAMLKALRWMGLDWDEGPDQGGSHGPYRQSERLDFYAAHADILVKKGSAYPCFCSDESLAAKRELAEKEKRAPIYDGSCADIDPVNAAQRAEKEAHTIRFRVPDRNIQVDDLVRGRVTFPAGTVGDFILLREGGMPVYNFACVVDDGLMEITHVLRGEDHLSNTLRQVMLYNALEMQEPRFGHLSMIHGEDKQKLSKRHGAVSVEAFRDKGYQPEALINYLALLGWNPGDERENMSLEELVGAFDVSRLNKSPAVFDLAKLNWLAGVKIREGKPEDLLEDARSFLPDETDELILKMIAAVQDHLHCLEDLPYEVDLLRGASPEPDEEALNWIAGADDLFEALAVEIETSQDPFAAATFKSAMKAAGKAAGRKGKDLFMPVRAKITGRIHGPDLSAVAEILGREETLARLRKE